MANWKYGQKYTREVLTPVVGESQSYAEVLRKLEVRQCGGNQTYIKRLVTGFGIDDSHFLGAAWNRGRKGSHNKRTAEEILTLRSPASHKETTAALRRALLESGVEHECQICGQAPEWKSRPLCLHIDHISGEYWDNRRENLRFLCPNCHSQTATYGFKNAKSQRLAT